MQPGWLYALAFAVAMNARPADSYFAGLGFELRSGAPPGLNPKLLSSSSAACSQVRAISSKTCRCRCDLVSPAQRMHSCANSRNSLGDAAMARSTRGTGGSATGLSATGACVRAAGGKGQDITLETVAIAVSRCQARAILKERARPHPAATVFSSATETGTIL
jgi:hypothetical protein